MRFIRYFISLLCVLAAAGIASAQTAQITGRITDSSGAVVVGASVEVTATATGLLRKATSNNEGYYSVPLLQPGSYRMTVRVNGFKPEGREGIKLEISQVARLDYALEIGSVTESVEVSAGAQLIQSETTEVGQVIDNKQILEMPLNGRNYLQLATLTAGVVPHRSLGDNGALTTGGMHRTQTDVLVDGNDNAIRFQGGPLNSQIQAVQPPVDSVGEFKVITNNMSAEHGFRAGAKILVGTKSGSNEIHGTLYEFLRNEKLDGTNFFANRSGAGKPAYRQNQFGGTVGGPIVKNRLFYFGSYQGTRIRAGQSLTSSVPSQEIARGGNFSLQPAVRRNIFDPLTLTGTGANAVRQAFPGNVIPVSRFDATGKALLDLYPQSNIAGRDNEPNNYFLASSRRNDDDQYDARTDYNLNDRQRIFVRYSLRDAFASSAMPLPFPAVGGAGTLTPLRSHNISTNLSSGLSPTMFNELRVGWFRTVATNDTPFTENWNQRLGIKNAPGDSFNDGRDQGYSVIQFNGFTQLGPPSNVPQFNRQRNLLIGDTLMWQKGAHTIKFGGEYRNLRIYRLVSAARLGNINFSGTYTAERPNVPASRAASGNSMADLLLGFSNQITYSNLAGEDLIQPYYGFFFQNDFKVTPRLTINLGVRWELFQNAIMPNLDQQPNFNLGRYRIPELNAISPEQEGMQFPKDSRDFGGPHDKNNFGPRFGIAYRLTNKTVLRGGGGFFFSQSDVPDQTGMLWRSGPPRNTNITDVYPFDMPTRRIFRDGFPNLVISDTLAPNSNVGVAPDFRPTTYVGQWFFDVQRELPENILLTIGYQGNKTTHAITNRQINWPATPHPTIQFAQRRIRPQLNQMNLFNNADNANYHAMVVKGEKRFSRGLSFLSSFTWAHAIDMRTEQADRWRNHHLTSIERGTSSGDVRLAYTLSALYELPFGDGKAWLKRGWLRHAVGGWQAGGLLSLYSGLPSDHNFNVDNQNTGGVSRGDWVRNPELPSNERSIDRWFDTGFVRAGVPGQLSNAGRNLILGPGSRNLDFVLTRVFRMPFEGHALHFRFESFNLTNTPNFGNPNVAVGTPAAGTINSADDPRRIQFALKYAF